jgi:hypothetical protein
MSWDRLILGEVGSAAGLRQSLDDLFEQQRRTFAGLREGEAALAGMRTREITRDGARVVVQVNPRRRRSTHARVDPASVSERPCFLCPENIPPEERGIAFGELVVLPNPYPVMPRHCTVPVRAHVPQRLAGRAGVLLGLAEALGPGMLAFYNGPRCGASAPDHMHFQACEGGGVPLVREMIERPGTPLRTRGRCNTAAGTGMGTVRSFSSFGRNFLVFEGRDAAVVEAGIHKTMDALAGFEEGNEEPMVSVIAVHDGGRFLCVVFPRARHRPACFFAEGEGRIAVSPAALEMAGLLVVAKQEHLEKIDAEMAAGIYAEVSLDEERFARLVREVT